MFRRPGSGARYEYHRVPRVSVVVERCCRATRTQLITRVRPGRTLSRRVSRVSSRQFVRADRVVPDTEFCSSRGPQRASTSADGCSTPPRTDIRARSSSSSSSSLTFFRPPTVFVAFLRLGTVAMTCPTNDTDGGCGGGGDWKDKYRALEKEYDDFREQSQSLERELEMDVEMLEKNNKELKSKNNQLQFDLDTQRVSTLSVGFRVFRSLAYYLRSTADVLRSQNVRRRQLVVSSLMVRCLDEKSRRTAKPNEPDTQLARGGYTFPRQRNQLRKIHQGVGTENRRLGKTTKVRLVVT